MTDKFIRRLDYFYVRRMTFQNQIYIYHTNVRYGIGVGRVGVNVYWRRISCTVMWDLGGCSILIFETTAMLRDVPELQHLFEFEVVRLTRSGENPQGHVQKYPYLSIGENPR